MSDTQPVIHDAFTFSERWLYGQRYRFNWLKSADLL